MGPTPISVDCTNQISKGRLEKARERVKQNHSKETESEKQTKLENARQYQKRKWAVETENDKQTRLTNAREYKKRKQSDQYAKKSEV